MVLVNNIVMEASSEEDKKYMKSMSKDDINQINGTLLQNLYKSVIDRKNIDFGDIPDSAGDIEKMKYYANTVECLDTLEKLYRQHNIEEPTLVTIRIAISNMKKYRPQFQDGFRRKHDFIMLTYNSLAMSIIDATSFLIASFMDYVVSPNNAYAVGKNANNSRGRVVTSSLEKFNSMSNNNQFGDALEYMLMEQRKNFAGETVVVTGAIIMILLSIVPIIRELIFFYYHSRVRLSDYLNMQADFLEMNKLAVQASEKSPTERKAIIKKQDDVIKKLMRKADKLQINDVDTNDVVKKEQKNEDSLWSLGNIEKQLSKNKLEGSSFMIV